MEEIGGTEYAGLGDQVDESRMANSYAGSTGDIGSAGTIYALREYSRNIVVNAIIMVTDFSKSMITLVSGFFVAYFALPKFLGLGIDDITK